MPDLLSTNPELLAKFRESDEAATAKVYLEYTPIVAKWLEDRVPGLPSAADHADAVQEVFIRAIQPEALRAYDGTSDYLSYLKGIGNNVVADHYRRRGREDLAPGRDSSDPADVLARAAHPDAAGAAAHGWLEQKARAIVREYVAALTEPLRSVHDAIYVRAMTQDGAAAELGLNRRKLQKLLERMLREVRALLEQAGIRDSNVTA